MERGPGNYAIRLVGYLSVSVLGKGILLYLASKDVYPERWVFRMLGLADSAWTLGGAASWILAGTFGLIGLAFAPQFLQLGQWSYRKFAGSAEPQRMPLNELYKQAKRLGWDFADNTGHVFDFVDGLKQAGADGHIQFSGTPTHRIPALTEDGFLQNIPSEYWQKCKLSAISPLELDKRDGHVIGIKGDNRKTETYNRQSGYIENYQDIHVDRSQALKWLKKESKQYMGRNKES